MGKNKGLVKRDDRALATTGTTELEVTDAQVIDAWLAWLRDSDRLAETTITAYRKGLDVFGSWLRETGNVGNVTPRIIIGFRAALEGQGYSAQTVNLRLGAVRSFYRYMVNTERLPVNPASEVKGIKRAKAGEHKRDALVNGEVVAVLGTCEGSPVGVRDRALLTMFSYCGLRTIEAQRADLADLRTKDGRMVLEVHGKGGSDRLAVIPREQEDTIRAWLVLRGQQPGPLFSSVGRQNPGARLALRTLRAIVKRRYRLAGVLGDRKTTHSLRHSAITNAIKNGATPLQVQSMAGHASYDTTLGYFHEVARTAAPAEDLVRYTEAS